MKQLFDLDSPLMAGLTRIADLIILNLLFLVCCIPVFTIGPAITAVYYVTLKMVKNEECYIVKGFFKSFKQNFKQGVAIWLIILAACFVIITDFRILEFGNNPVQGVSSGLSGAVIIVLLVSVVILLFVFMYVFPVLAKFDNTVKNTMKNALFMSIRHLPFTVLIILIHLIPFIVFYVFPPAMLFIIISYALCAYGCSFIFNKIFSIYAKATEITSDEDFSISQDEDNYFYKSESSDEIETIENKEANIETTEE